MDFRFNLLFSFLPAQEDKYKVLFEALPPRHLFIPLEFENLTGQIVQLVHLDIYNYIIFSTPNAISETLARASSPSVLDGPYFNIDFAWYSMSMVSVPIKFDILILLIRVQIF